MTHSSKTEIDHWFIEGTLAGEELALPEVWDPVFDPDRHLVLTKIGPYWRLFLRPEGFVKRFYHSVYALPVESWILTRSAVLYDGFCTIDVTLDMHFQASLKYALNNMDILSGINDHIKNTYEDILLNMVDKELLNLTDGSWVLNGVTKIERKISLAISEMLVLQNIQSQVLCTIKPVFADFPEVQLAQENVYLCVLKKSFELNEAKRQELFNQEQESEKQRQEQKQLQLEQISRDAKLERQRQAQEALNNKLLLEDKEKQLIDQFEIERRIHAQQVQHENTLKEITLKAELEEQQKQESRLRIAEQNAQMENLAHQAKLKAQELESDIAKYENQQARWRESKDKVHAQQVAFEQRQKQLEFDHEIENQKRREQQRLEMQKESFQKRKESDVYLRREIELLELEKQRLELQLSIKDAKKQENGSENIQNLT